MTREEKIFYIDNYGTDVPKEIRNIDEALKQEMFQKRKKYLIGNACMAEKQEMLGITDLEETIKKERMRKKIPYGELCPTEKLIKSVDKRILSNQFQSIGYSVEETNMIVESIFKNYSKIPSLCAKDYDVRKNYDTIVVPEKYRYERLQEQLEKGIE